MQQPSRIRSGLASWLAAFAVLAVFCVSAAWEPATGCTATDLTSIPDTGFLGAQAAAAPVDGSAAPAEKLVCLTFDDGPSKNTTAILEILEQHQIPATFFVIAAENNQRWLPAIADEVRMGHQIALHSASHEYKKIYQSPTAFWEDIDQLKAQISPYVNVELIDCLRFPGGSTNTVSHKYGGSEIMTTLKAQAEEKGYHWIDWNVCAGDAVGGHPSADKLLQNIQEEAQDRSVCVVLMHDTAMTGTTVEALPRIIDWFQSQGYHFCTVDQMLALRG